jgi:hypothetical protein
VRSGLRSASKSPQGCQLSGEGVVSVRLPRSLLGLFRTVAEQRGISVHEAARRIVSSLTDLAPDELKLLKDPPREVDTPRLSLYLGWDLVDVLAGAAEDSGLGNSCILRRVIYGLFITREIAFVQQNGQSKLQIAPEKYTEKFNAEGRKN